MSVRREPRRSLRSWEAANVPKQQNDKAPSGGKDLETPVERNLVTVLYCKGEEELQAEAPDSRESRAR